MINRFENNFNPFKKEKEELIDIPIEDKESGIEQKIEVAAVAENKAVNMFAKTEKEISDVEKNEPPRIIEKARENNFLEEKIKLAKEKASFVLERLKMSLFKDTSDTSVNKIDFSFSPMLAAKKLFELPKEERKEMIKKIRREIYRQNKKIAEIEIHLIGKLENGTEDGELSEEIERISQENKLRLDQYKILRQAVNEAIIRRWKIKRLKEEYPTPELLFKAAFGKQPTGRIKLENSQLGIIFIVENVDDYGKAYFADEDIYNVATKKNENSGVLRDIEEKRAKQLEKIKYSKGITIEKTLIKGIDYGVAVIKKLPGMNEAVSHEKEHIIQSFFQEGSNYYMELIELIKNNAEVGEKSGTERKIDFMEKISNKWLDNLLAFSLKLEMLAFFKSGYPVSRIRDKFLFGKSYNFFNENLEAQKSLLVSIAGDNLVKEVERIIEDREKDYDHLIEDSVVALRILEQVGFRRDEGTAILRQYPLKQWKNVAKEIYKGKIAGEALH